MMRKRYRCSDCSRQFDYDHHPSIEADPLPGECPYSDCRSNAAALPGIVAPHLAMNSIVRAVDDTYRGMEEGSEVRAQMAQEFHGVDASEAANMKITNILDGRREGESSDPQVNNAVSQSMASTPGVGFQGASGLGYSQSVSQGPYPNAGLRAMMDVRARHNQVAARVTGGAGGAFTVDRPAIETQVPGYKRRA